MFLKLGDYSFLRVKEKSREQATKTARKGGMGAGTMMYMAPEVFFYTGDRPQPPADIWSASVTVMHMWAEPLPQNIGQRALNSIFMKEEELPGQEELKDPIKGILQYGLRYKPEDRLTAKGMAGLIGIISDYKEESYFGCKVSKSPM